MGSVNGRSKFECGESFALQSDTLRRKVSAMNRTEAEEHLRVIRSLMEKATIYRALSAPTALVGGLASLLFGGWLFFRWRPLPAGREGDQFVWLFLAGWAAVLVIAGVANTWFLWRDAQHRGECFLSSGMRHALVAMSPAMLCGAGLSVFLIWWERPFWLPPVWMLCYALALLATRSFAPRSIQRLGWTFFLAGFIALIGLSVVRVQAWWGDGGTHLPTAANLSMVATFGLFHVIYAACAWPRGAAGKAAV
jgi:hypothetical protein